MNAITFESIEKSIAHIDPDGSGDANAALPDLAGVTQRLLSVYRGVRPILSVVAALPLLPPKFRQSLRQFLATLDQFTEGVAGIDGAFKAGKDL